MVSFIIPPRARAVMREGDFVEVVEAGNLIIWVGGGQPPEGTGGGDKQAPGLPVPGVLVQGPTTPLSQCSAGKDSTPRAPLLKVTGVNKW